MIVRFQHQMENRHWLASRTKRSQTGYVVDIVSRLVTRNIDCYRGIQRVWDGYTACTRGYQEWREDEEVAERKCRADERLPHHANCGDMHTT